jgi:hypothetical protein
MRKAVWMGLASLALTGAAAAQVPAWLQGEWTRDWIQRGSAQTNTHDIHYLQTAGFFADIRLPRDRAGLSAAKSFADLTDSQLSLLAGQNGLEGVTTVQGDVATWSDEVSFQPSDGSPDSGRLQRIPPDRMHEIGLNGSYTESWRHAGGEQGPFLVVRVERAGRLHQTLVVVGDRFIYVRNRAKDLPTAASLKELIDSTHATREQIVAYLDCEFSVGRVRGGAVPWGIEQSTLPWREGQRLDFVADLSKPHHADQWTVPVNTLPAGESGRLFRKSP